MIVMMVEQEVVFDHETHRFKVMTMVPSCLKMSISFLTLVMLYQLYDFYDYHVVMIMPSQSLLNLKRKSFTQP